MSKGGLQRILGEEPVTYKIYKDGSIYRAKSGSATGSDYSGADASTVIQSAIDNADNGGMFVIQSPFTITAPIVIPDAANTLQKPFWIRGVYDPSRNGYGTVITASSSFPNQRFMFETSALTGTRKSTLFLEKLYLYNPHGVGLGGSNLDIGGVKIEQVGSIGADIKMRDMKIQYMWRGIHMVGYIYRLDMQNIYVFDSNTNFVGDFDVKFEKSSYLDKFKISSIINLQTSHLAGSSGGTGKMNNSIYLDGAYNNFYGTVVDGWVYTNAPVYLKNAYTNHFYGLMIIDLNNNPTPDTRVGALVLDGSSAGVASDNCFANVLHGVEAPNYPDAVVFLNGAYRNTIELNAYFGGDARINDTNAGAEGNTVIVTHGHRITPSATTKIVIVSTNKTKVIDTRYGATREGTSTQSGNGSTKIFNIAHGCFTTPGYFEAWPTSSDAQGTPSLFATSTNIVITYPVAPPSGTNNLSWTWKAEVTYL